MYEPWITECFCPCWSIFVSIQKWLTLCLYPWGLYWCLHTSAGYGIIFMEYMYWLSSFVHWLCLMFPILATQQCFHELDWDVASAYNLEGLVELILIIQLTACPKRNDIRLQWYSQCDDTRNTTAIPLLWPNGFVKFDSAQSFNLWGYTMLLCRNAYDMWKYFYHLYAPCVRISIFWKQRKFDKSEFVCPCGGIIKRSHREDNTRVTAKGANWCQTV